MNLKYPVPKKYAKKKKTNTSFNRYDIERDSYEDYYQSKIKSDEEVVTEKTQPLHPGENS
ncbi:MAG: hypothetical protein PHY42_05015 [Bacilli bacterium]|nr:hypothetical protein [Bacilli bacterium]